MLRDIRLVIATLSVATRLLQPPAACAQSCLEAAAAAEIEHRLPPGLLQAIARAETGRLDPATSALIPWPWSVDVDGQGTFFADAASAARAAAAWQAQGVHSMDVGCLQVNLRDHPRAFASLEEAFDPGANARYAGEFLSELHAEFGDWPRAVAAYHSRTPELGGPYAARVLALWTGSQTEATPPAATAARRWFVAWQPPAIAAGRLLAAMDACIASAPPRPAWQVSAWALPARRCPRSPFASVTALHRALSGD